MTGAPMPSGDNRPGLRPRRLTDEPTGPDEPVRRSAGERFSAVLSSVWSSVRPTRNRATGYVAVGAVGALVGTSAIVGVGAAGAVPDLADIGAWLGSSEKGSAAHANGLTGDVDGKVDLPTGKNPISISQDGKTVLVLDKKTGKVVRIDPSQLTAEQSTNYSSSDLQLIAGGSFAYILNPVKGTVQRINPMTTSPIGAPIDLGTKPLGDAVVDPKGTLWVPQPTTGSVTPFPNGKKAGPIKVAKGNNHNLMMTLANGRAMVTDTADAITTMLDVRSTGLKVKLPSFLQKASPEDVLVPAATEGDVVPVLAAESGKLALLDTRTAELTSASLGGDGGSEYGAPQVLGSKVYIPDHSDGTLKVYDTVDSTIEEPIQVTKEPGELEVFVRNGLLWVNDQDNEAAAVINSQGEVSNIGKYKTDVPSSRKPDENPPVEDSGPGEPAPDPGTADPNPNPDPGTSGGNGDPDPKPEPEPTKTEKPKPKPPECVEGPSGCGKPHLPPGTPQAQAGPNGVTVTFSPSAGVKPERYTLPKTSGGDMAIPGMKVSPDGVGPDGPFQFQVTGLDCSREYTFRVIAHFKGGVSKASQLSAPVRPCTAPAAPRNLRVTPNQGGKGGQLTWQPPANASGKVGYRVQVQGGQTSTTTETNDSVSGLANGRSYTITVTSSNEAGGGASASVTLNLTPPQRTKNIVNNFNDGQPVRLRSGPGSNNSQTGSIPSGWNGAVTVFCRLAGTNEVHPNTGKTSNIWARINYNGKVAWVSDLWLEVADDSDVWACE